MYRERYKAQYDVDILYDQSLIVDDVFQIHEMTEISLVGAEENTKRLQRIIEEQIEALNVVTLQVSLNDGKYLKESIYTLKTQIDPAELRIKRTTNHTEMKDLNHPFYFIPNYTKDVLIIGFEEEVRRAEVIITSFLCKKYNNKRMYTLSHLLPIDLLENIKRIRVDVLQKVPGLQMFIYEPNPPRKHITILLMGTWTEIRLSKRYLDKQIERINAGALENFQGFVMLQQVRFTYKNLKRFLLENNTKVIKHWDLNSSLFNLLPPTPPFGSSTALMPSPYKSHISDPLLTAEDKLLPDDSLRSRVYAQMEPETIINLLFASGKQRIPLLIEDMKKTKKDVLEYLSRYLKDTIQIYEQSMCESPRMQDAAMGRESEPLPRQLGSHSRSRSRGRKRSSSRSRSRSRSRSHSRSRSRSRSSSSRRRSEDRSDDRRRYRHHSHHHYSPHHSRRRRRDEYKEVPRNGEPVPMSEMQPPVQHGSDIGKFTYKSYYPTNPAVQRHTDVVEESKISK